MLYTACKCQWADLAVVQGPAGLQQYAEASGAMVMQGAMLLCLLQS